MDRTNWYNEQFKKVLKTALENDGSIQVQEFMIGFGNLLFDLVTRDENPRELAKMITTGLTRNADLLSRSTEDFIARCEAEPSESDLKDQTSSPPQS